MTQLYLIRHGEAVVNVEPIIGGMKGDTGLTPRGVKQAEALRDHLAETGKITPDIIIGSTLPRARQTAEIVSPAFGDMPIEWDDDVQELRVGEADGLSHEETWSRYGTPDFEFDPFRPIAPGGEHWGLFMLRVSSTIHRLIRDHRGKRIVVFTHGGFIDGSFAYFLNINTRTPTRLEFYPHNTSITYWEETSYRDQQTWRLVSYNDVAHLRHVGADESPKWANLDADPSAD